MSLADDYKNEYSKEDDINIKRSSTMQITGQILNVVPRMKDGYPETFTTPNGQFYVFEMAIQQPSGPISGQINSKSPQYPLAAGAEITVEQSLGNQNEVKFKKINLQYQQGQQQPQQQSYQQQPQQGQQQAPPPQQQAQPQDSVQDRIAFAQAYNRASDEYIAGKIEQEQIHERTKVHYKVLTTRQFPFEMSLSGPATQEQSPPQAPPQQQAPPPQLAPQQDTTDYGATLEQDIPF
jgi:hypothetical protein